MDRLCYLSNFFEAAADDPRIGITHIAVYAVLLQYWSEHHFANPLQVFGHEIMRMAKIAGTTWYKSIRELDEYGYIRYEPSFKRNQGSKVFMLWNCMAKKQIV